MFRSEISSICWGVVWSLIVTVGMVGWGILLKKLLGQGKNNNPLWMLAALGVAAFTAVGGILDVLEIATYQNLVITLIAGLAAWAVGKGPHLLWEEIRDNSWPAIPVFLVALAIVSIGGRSPIFSANWDDLSGYLPVSLEMGANGSSWAPLSLRRAVSWGGQYPLQTLGMVPGDETKGYVFDRGVGTWILCLAVLATIRKHPQQWVGALLACGMLVLPQTAINSAPAVLLVVLTAALWDKRAEPALAGLLSMALVAMRSQTLIPVIIINGWALWEARHLGWWHVTKSATTRGAVGIMTLAPYLLNYNTMFGNYAFFLHPNTINKDYVTFIGTWDPLGIGERLGYLVLGSMPMVGAFLILSLNKKTRAIGLIGLATFVAITITMPEYSLTEWKRYTWPILSACILIAFLGQWARPSKRMAILAVALLLTEEPLGILYINWAKNRQQDEVLAKKEWNWAGGNNAQLEVPEGKTILMISGSTALLDFKRNKILVWDSMPAVGGPPLNGSLADWRGWLEKLGVDYVITIDPDKEIGLDSKKTQRSLWLSPNGQSTDLKHYRRVWFPDREKGLNAISMLVQHKPWKTVWNHVIIPVGEIEKTAETPKPAKPEEQPPEKL